jgi:hypothetical protein
MRVLEMIAFGMNGAALTALGDIDGSFLGVVTGMAGGPLGERCEGVKLGESTLRVFFITLLHVELDRTIVGRCSSYLSVCMPFIVDVAVLSPVSCLKTQPT